MEVTRTEHPIEFEQEGSGKHSMFYLYPVKGVHKPKDVQRSKFWLKNNLGNKDSFVQVRWKMMNDEPTLLRIPDSALLSRLQVELGQKEAYILELEEKLQQKEDTKLTREEIKELHEKKEYRQMKELLEKWKKRMNAMRKNLSDAAIKLADCGGRLPKGVTLDDSGNPQFEEDGQMGDLD